jgi:hypothetical protein
MSHEHHSPQRVVEDDQEDAVEDEEVCSCSKDCDFLSAVACKFPVPVADAHTPALARRPKKERTCESCCDCFYSEEKEEQKTSKNKKTENKRRSRARRWRAR